MSRDTCVALFLMGELVATLQANDSDLLKRWLYGVIKTESSMKFSPLLTTLFFLASPAFADDFIYLKCTGTTNNTLWDFDKTKELQNWDSNFDLAYKLDTKNEKIFVSSNPGVAIKYEPQHPGFIGWEERISNERFDVESFRYLHYNPAGKVDGFTELSDKLRRRKHTASMVGTCKTSDAFTFEASK